MAFKDPRLQERRRLVAQLHLRNTPSRQIADTLTRQGWRCTHTTVLRDLTTIHAEWRHAYIDDMVKHVARELAKLDEVERVAWLQSPPDLAIILRVIDQRCKLLRLYGYAPAAADVVKELTDLGYDAAQVLADVERYLDQQVASRDDDRL